MWHGGNSSTTSSTHESCRTRCCHGQRVAVLGSTAARMHARMRVHARMHECTSTYLHTWAHARTRTHTHARARVHTHKRARTHVHTQVHTHALLVGQAADKEPHSKPGPASQASAAVAARRWARRSVMSSRPTLPPVEVGKTQPSDQLRGPGKPSSLKLTKVAVGD